MRSLLCLVVAAAAAAAGCGSDARVADDLSQCAVEFDLERGALPAEVATFSARVARLPGVDRVETVTREDNIKRTLALARADRLPKRTLRAVEARARAEAGSTLVAVPARREDANRILAATRELPGVVIAVHGRDACELANS